MSEKLLVDEGRILFNYDFSKMSITTARNVFLKAVCSNFSEMFSNACYRILAIKRSLSEMYFPSS